MTAREYLQAVVAGQRHRHASDNGRALDKRFADRQVVTRAGRVLEPGDPVTVGEDIFFYRIPVDLDADIPAVELLFADEHLTVAVKPHGLSTAPKGAHIMRSVVVQVRRATGNMDLVPVHRLDRLTKGLVVCANKPAERGAYQRLFADGAVGKTYRAITAAPGTGSSCCRDIPATVGNRLVKTHGQLQTVAADGPINAVTRITAVRPLDDSRTRRALELFGPPPAPAGPAPGQPAHHGTRLAEWTVEPVTGKTHQIRKHLSDLGFGILGDPLYPVVDRHRLNDLGALPLALCCTGIGFTDPVTGSRRHFTGPGLL